MDKTKALSRAKVQSPTGPDRPMPSRFGFVLRALKFRFAPVFGWDVGFPVERYPSPTIQLIMRLSLSFFFQYGSGIFPETLF